VQEPKSATYLHYQLLAVDERNVLADTFSAAIAPGKIVLFHQLDLPWILKPPLWSEAFSVCAKDGLVAVDDMRIRADFCSCRYMPSSNLDTAWRNKAG